MSSLKLIFTYFKTGLCSGSGSGFSGCDGKERQPESVFLYVEVFSKYVAFRKFCYKSNKLPMKHKDTDVQRDVLFSFFLMNEKKAVFNTLLCYCVL